MVTGQTKKKKKRTVTDGSIDASHSITNFLKSCSRLKSGLPNGARRKMSEWCSSCKATLNWPAIHLDPSLQKVGILWPQYPRKFFHKYVQYSKIKMIVVSKEFRSSGPGPWPKLGQNFCRPANLRARPGQCLLMFSLYKLLLIYYMILKCPFF